MQQDGQERAEAELQEGPSASQEGLSASQEGLSASQEGLNAPQEGLSASQEGPGTFQGLSAVEAAAVLALMEEHEEPLLSHSVAFTEHLDQELRGLEEANLRAIISSEQQVAQLMSSLDEALAEVARVEETLQEQADG